MPNTFKATPDAAGLTQKMVILKTDFPVDQLPHNLVCNLDSNELHYTHRMYASFTVK